MLRPHRAASHLRVTRRGRKKKRKKRKKGRKKREENVAPSTMSANLTQTYKHTRSVEFIIDEQL